MSRCISCGSKLRMQAKDQEEKYDDTNDENDEEEDIDTNNYDDEDEYFLYHDDFDILGCGDHDDGSESNTCNI
jgi:hypothetical protein